MLKDPEVKTMATDRINDARAFRDFLDAKLLHSNQSVPLDDALGLWEYENQTEDERLETLQAIQAGLDDMRAGRTRPAEGALRELCRKHGLPEPQ
jgi:hypothetical protein